MHEIWCDGACRGNPGPGGWGTIIILKKGDETLDVIELSGSNSHTTNNRMELQAAIEGLVRIPEGQEVDLYSDSQYLINTMSMHWRRLRNRDLWTKLDNACTNKTILWHWVRGHNGDPMNERADRLAVGAIK